jgi:SEC-C motif-containing protein
MSEKKQRMPGERELSTCPCKSGLSYGECCMPFHHGKAKPGTAEKLMRSRYSAYFFRRVDYLVDTTHPDTKDANLKPELEKMIHQINWTNLTIVESSGGARDDKSGKVEFIAEYFLDGELNQLHERSRFKRFKGAWKYLDGKQ